MIICLQCKEKSFSKSHRCWDENIKRYSVKTAPDFVVNIAKIKYDVYMQQLETHYKMFQGKGIK